MSIKRIAILLLAAVLVALTACTSRAPSLTTTPVIQAGYRPSDEFVASVSLMNNYSVSVEILEYATGKRVSLTRGNPNFDEVLRLLSASTTKQTTLKTGTKIEDGKTVSIQRTIPYAMGYILTFDLKNGRQVKFDITPDSIWFETDEAIYQAAVSPDFYSLLKQWITNPGSLNQVAGQQFVKNILDSLQASSGWTPPLPPTGGQKPRALTKQELDKVLEIASAVPIVKEVKQNKDITSVDTSYLWVGWNGHADGESFLNYEAVANGTANLSDKGDTWYPAADFLFHSTYGDYGKVGIHVAVNLETGKVVWLGGYTQFPIPSKLPYTTSPSLTPIVFTKITAPLTLNGEKPGTDIPQGSTVYHWANGITEVYGADGNRIFIAKDSEAASLPHPSGPNGPFTSPATFIYQVPSGSSIGKEVTDGNDKITTIRLGDKLILTIVAKSENFSLGDYASISISPSPGSYITNSENKSSEVLLKDVQVNKGISDKEYFSPRYVFKADESTWTSGYTVKAGEPILIVSGSIQNKHPQNKEIAMYAEGYDASGKQVTWTLDAAHIAGQIGLHLENEATGQFTLHLNIADNIKSIRIFANNYAVTPP